MLASLSRDRDEPTDNRSKPHLSHSRVNRYLLCPEQYRLYYLEKLRPKVPSASLVFGQVVHQSLAELFQKKNDPVQSFQIYWMMLKDLALDYSPRESWEKLKACGEGLLAKFASESLPRLTEIKSVEKPFSLTITSLELPFVGILDLVARVDGKTTVVDWKTAGSLYEEHEAAMSDQLSAYQLAEPEAEQLAFCVLVKTKEPQIVWQSVSRTAVQLVEYITKLGFVETEIAHGKFYKRPGMWCSWCDFLPVCLGNKWKVRESLVSIP